MIKKIPTYGGYGGDHDARVKNFVQLAHAIREARAIKNDFERNKQLISDVVARPSPPTNSAMTLAQKILHAGQLRRGEISNVPPLDPNSTAAKILAAGRLRRGEETEQDQAEQTEKLSPTARAILNAGRRRRNEPEI